MSLGFAVREGVKEPVSSSGLRQENQFKTWSPAESQLPVYEEWSNSEIRIEIVQEISLSDK